MSLHRIVVFALVTVLAAPSAVLAQDDFLAPLTSPSKPKAGKPKVVKKKPAKATAKKPARAKAPAKGSKKPAAEDDLLLAPLTPVKTEVLVRMTGNVRGAKLFVDGKEFGVLSSAAVPVEVRPGEHHLVVRRQGYADFTRRIDVKPGTQAEVLVSMDATMGFATLTADVADAVVMVDGQQVGAVPQANVLLRPGSREIEFRAPGFKPDVHNITVFAGRTYEVTGNLRPLLDTSVATADVPKNPVLEPSSKLDPDDETAPGLSFAGDPETPEVEGSKPWYGRWYVWAGIGAVVAAGTVGAVMATQGGGASPLSPDAVCGPAGCDAVLGGIRSVRGGGAGLQAPAPAGAIRF
ncbi:PEGA domain-containing protein [Myxococcus xanthus]|uniref:PEGA domain-containing protein n=1 Tax=Myxococcus xanthus TaxID=34 RepID=A0A7Y4IGD8_MYXXA|nr:PEGA domain-containing protein [Myxococcus xanthus]NOJ78591.1 PEGA domain-containing protein [Myxococcus xanthus]NOJ86431.1 PEGA domain-containing protein [Myxococcus xanthus]